MMIILIPNNLSWMMIILHTKQSKLDDDHSPYKQSKLDDDHSPYKQSKLDDDHSPYQTI